MTGGSPPPNAGIHTEIAQDTIGGVAATGEAYAHTTLPWLTCRLVSNLPNGDRIVSFHHGPEPRAETLVQVATDGSRHRRALALDPGLAAELGARLARADPGAGAGRAADILTRIGFRPDGDDEWTLWHPQPNPAGCRLKARQRANAAGAPCLQIGTNLVPGAIGRACKDWPDLPLATAADRAAGHAVLDVLLATAAEAARAEMALADLPVDGPPFDFDGLDVTADGTAAVRYSVRRLSVRPGHERTTGQTGTILRITRPEKARPVMELPRDGAADADDQRWPMLLRRLGAIRAWGQAPDECVTVLQAVRQHHAGGDGG